MTRFFLAVWLLVLVSCGWAQGTAPELVLQVGHTAAVTSMAALGEGAVLATGSKDGTAKLWDGKSGALLYSLPHEAPVLAVRFNPDGQLITAATGGTVRFWNPATGALRRMTAGAKFGATAAAISPDGKLAAFGTPDGKILLRETETGRVARTLEGHPTAIRDLEFSPDGSRLVSTSEAYREKVDNPEFARRAGDVRIWEVASGDLLKVLRGHALTVFGAAWSPDGKRLASVGESGTTVIWDAATYAKLDEANISLGKGAALAVAWGPAGRRVLSGWRGGLEATAVSGAAATVWKSAAGEPVTAIIGLPNGSVVAGRRDGVLLWFTGEGQAVKPVQNQMSAIVKVRVAPDGHSLATADANGVLGIWNLDKGTLERAWAAQLPDVRDLQFSPDGMLLAVAAKGGLSLYRLPDGRFDREVWTFDQSVGAITFSGDGKQLALGLNSPAGAGSVRLFNLEDSSIRGLPLDGPALPARWLGFTASGHLASVWGRGLQGNLTVWDPAGKVRIFENFRGGSSGALSPNGRRLVTAGALLDENQDFAPAGEQLQLWNLTAGEKSRLLETSAPEDRALDVAISPDGNLLASAGWDGKVRLWTVDGGKPRELEGHLGAANTVAFVPGTKPMLASGGNDGSVRLWDTETGRLRLTLLTLPTETPRSEPIMRSYPTGPQAVPKDWRLFTVGTSPAPLAVDWLAVTPEGYFDGSPGADRYLQWRLGPDVFPLTALAAGYRRADFVERAAAGETVANTAFAAGEAVPPQATILLPKAGERANSPLRVRVEATDDKNIASVQLLVDGRIAATKTVATGGKPLEVGAKPLEVGAKALMAKPLEVGAKPLEVGAKPLPTPHKAVWDVDFSTEVPAGASEGMTLKALVTDSEGLQSSDEIRLRGVAGQGPKGNLYVLSVGVSQYENPAYNLRYAASDAAVFGMMWQAQQGRLYESVTSKVLTDVAATSAGVQTALREITRAAGPEDTIAIFLSGHGVQAGPKEFYFATHDVNLGNLPGTALPWTAFRTALANASARRVLLFLDACHSGNALGGRQAGNESLAADLAQNAGVVVIVSSLGSQYSYELPAVQHGAFTQALWEGIGGGKADLDSGAGKDGVISAEELLTFLRTRVPALTENAQMPACPLLQDFGEGFPVARVGSVVR